MLQEITHIEYLISENSIQEAIDLLRQVLAISGTDYQNEVLILAGRYAKLRSQIRKGILSKAEQDLEYARIVNALLEIKDELKGDTEQMQGFADLKTHLEDAAKKFNMQLTDSLQQAVIRRIVFVKELGIDFRILWIDDKPHLIEDEKAVFEAMDVELEVATSSDEAQTLIANNPPYDLILSDVGRDENPEGGFLFAHQLAIQDYPTPFIFYTIYTGKPLAPPVNAFGIAFLPNDLFHLVLDVMERKG